MVAGIAHEINNPLAIINGRVQILRTKTVSGQLTNEELLLALDKLSQTVFRVSKIITGLRSFVRPGTGEQPEDVVPARAIEDALDFCKGRFHKQNIRIVLEVTSNRLVHCVPVQLSQILLNLLNNSLHALDGCSEKWVRIEAHDVDDSVRFKVVDSGPGVPVEIAERIFEPFFTTKEMPWNAARLTRVFCSRCLRFPTAADSRSRWKAKSFQTTCQADGRQSFFQKAKRRLGLSLASSVPAARASRGASGACCAVGLAGAEAYFARSSAVDSDFTRNDGAPVGTASGARGGVSLGC
jgi:hypothetical protein